MFCQSGSKGKSLFIQEADKLINFVKKNEVNKFSKEFSILGNILLFFKKVLLFDTHNEVIAGRVFEFDVHIMNYLL